MTRAHRRFFAAVAAVTMASVPLDAALAQGKPATDARAEARSRFDGGLALFEDGNNAAALAEFQRAYDLIPNAVVLFNIGLVYAAMNRPAESAEALQKVIKEPGGLSPDVLARANQTLSQQLARIAEIIVECNVPATIEVDNVEAAKAPLAGPLKVAGGSHVIGAIAAGYTPQRKQVTVAGGAKSQLRFSLTPMEGTLAHLALKTRLPGADVKLDGELVGHTPLTSSLTLMPGKHKVELVRAGYYTASSDLTLGDGASGEITLEPEEDRSVVNRIGGDLKLVISETDAVITVDGKSRGPYTASLRLAPGVHHLLVERGGFRPIERDVDVTSGQTTVVPIVLDPTPEMRELYVSRARTQQMWGWISFGGGLALAGGGIGYLVYNASAKDDARAARDAAASDLENQVGVCDTSTAQGNFEECNRRVLSTQDQYNSVKARDTIGYVGIGVGAAATGLGLFLLVSGDSPHKYDKKPTPELMRSIKPQFAIGPGSAVLTLHGSF